jgi:hypothetical protein
MTKLQLILAIVGLLKAILVDKDGDGRIDILDSAPDNPEVK